MYVSRVMLMELTLLTIFPITQSKNLIEWCGGWWGALFEDPVLVAILFMAQTGNILQDVVYVQVPRYGAVCLLARILRSKRERVKMRVTLLLLLVI